MNNEIQKAFEEWMESKILYSKDELLFRELFEVNENIDSIGFFAGYKSRDTEVKELEEAVEEEMGHVNRLIEENKLLRDALEYVANGGSKPSMMARKTLNMIGKE